jgi:hypothetical protein
VVKLIEPLACGIRGAEVGSVVLLQRGTSTNATYYTDFEANQQFSASPIALDSNGSAVLYVNQLVDVQVRDAAGLLVREFVAGEAASSVEVISQSFTGTDYRDGSSGVNKPTVLSTVLDRWATSAGSADWKVLVGGVATTIQAAVVGLTGLFYNVRSYGALGNGVADDGAAIALAVVAATAAGGTVFFPAGVYRTTTTISVPPQVNILGVGVASKVAVDAAGAVNLFEFTGSDSGTRSVRDLWLGAMNQVNNGILARIIGTATRIVFDGCVFGNDNFANGAFMLATVTNSISALVSCVRCAFYQAFDNIVILQNGICRMVLRDCDFIVTQVGVHNATVVVLLDGALIDSCRFDASATTGGAAYYVSYGTPTNFGGCVFTSNRFKAAASMLAAFRNTVVNPNSAMWESGNSFGDLLGGSMPGYSDTTDGYAPVTQDIAGLRSRISREQRSFGVTSNGAALAVDAKSYGMIIVSRTVAGAQTINANAGTMGDRLQVVLINTTGGALVPTFGTNFAPRGGLANIPNITRGCFNFIWVPNVLLGGAGNWMQSATESYS